MKEWLKKYLGWLGFGFWIAATLLFCVSEYILDIELDANILFCSLVIMTALQTIQDILNEKYLTKYSQKVKNTFMVFILTSSLIMFYFIIFV